MRAVSDFLDRVATRALGSASMLSPRLPSLFEPAAGGGAAVVEESLQIQASSPKEPMTAPSLPDTRQAEGRATSADASAPSFAPKPPREIPAPTTTRERVILAEDVRLLVPDKPSAREPAIETAPTLVASHRDPAAAGELSQPRETHVLHERIVTAPRQEQQFGTLLPPDKPVFATRQEPQARSARAGSPLSAKAAAIAPQASGEPAVQVSIGRIEVRATPAHAPTPRRQETPRPSALDDYLRQRGGSTP